jgi:hypothetical protein
MLSYLKKPFNRQIHWHILVILMMAISIVCTFSRCTSTSSPQTYEDSQLGLSLEYPKNWNLQTSERLDNLIVLQSTGEPFAKDSARIELLVSPPNSSSFNLEEGLENRIKTKARLYDLESVTIIQLPTRVENQDYEIAVATIAIPTMSIPENSHRNQMGLRDLNTIQMVDMYVIRNNDNRYVEINIYRSESEELNTQAEAIVNSIRFVAPNIP